MRQTPPQVEFVLLALSLIDSLEFHSFRIPSVIIIIFASSECLQQVSISVAHPLPLINPIGLIFNLALDDKTTSLAFLFVLHGN